MQDHRFFDLDSLTELEDASIFKLESMPSISFEENDFVIQGITIEMNLDLVVIARSGYTVLDYLSDVGGIQGLLLSLSLGLLTFFNFNMLDDYMVSQLFKMQTRSAGNDIVSQDIELKTSFMQKLKDLIRNHLPSCLRCYKMSRQ